MAKKITSKIEKVDDKKYFGVNIIRLKLSKKEKTRFNLF